MTEKELKKLSRGELLQLLLAQTREVEYLRQRLEKTEAMLNERNLHMTEAGDLAHAVLEINGVMEAAQAAAQQYLENIRLMEEQTRAECDSLLKKARDAAARASEAENEQVSQ